MPASVTIEATGGPLAGRRLAFAEADLLVVGKSGDCGFQLPSDDQFASRHHLILEIRPPRVAVRDLGSLNGTYVNGEKIGSRELTETPEEGAAHDYRTVELADGDELRASATRFRIAVVAPPVCPECGDDLVGIAGDAADARCARCRARSAAQARPAPRPEPGVPPRPSGEGGGASDDPMAVLLNLLFERHGAALRPGDGEARRIPGYEIGRMLGKGGMGAVYLATRARDGAEVAVKVMLAESPAGSKAREVFAREVEMQQRLGEHPNCVTVLDFDLEGRAAWFVMEYCPGGSVDDLMKRRGGRLSVAEAGPLMLGALAGLQHAHERSVIHRDLKPQNILLSRREGGTARLTDFGLAKDFELAGMSGMTRTGAVGGTPVFLPREQVINFKYMRPDTDVCGMAATFYNMLTGAYTRDGFGDPNRGAAEIILGQPYVPIRRRDPSIKRTLAEVLDRAGSDDTAARPQTAAAFREALAEVL